MNELNHEDSLNCLVVVTGDADIAVRQYMRKKPNESYYNFNGGNSKKSRRPESI